MPVSSSSVSKGGAASKLQGPNPQKRDTTSSSSSSGSDLEDQKKANDLPPGSEKTEEFNVSQTILPPLTLNTDPEQPSEQDPL